MPGIVYVLNQLVRLPVLHIIDNGGKRLATTEGLRSSIRLGDAFVAF